MADVTATAEPVRLTLKSPSSQFKDLEIEASLSWSIRQLKTHVSKTHPAKPVCFTLALCAGWRDRSSLL